LTLHAVCTVRRGALDEARIATTLVLRGLGPGGTPSTLVADAVFAVGARLALRVVGVWHLSRCAVRADGAIHADLTNPSATQRAIVHGIVVGAAELGAGNAGRCAKRLCRLRAVRADAALFAVGTELADAHVATRLLRVDLEPRAALLALYTVAAEIVRIARVDGATQNASRPIRGGLVASLAGNARRPIT